MVSVETLITEMGKTDPEFEFLMKRLAGPCFDVLYCLNEFGPLKKPRLKHKLEDTFEMIPEDIDNSIHKLKAYNLIKPMKRTTGYWLDLTEKALLFLKYHELRLSASLKQKRLEK